MRVVVRAPARLHFGFIDLDGSLGRRFGSIGLAIDEPKVIVEATPAHRLSVTGDESGRAQALARRFLRHYRLRESVHIALQQMIPAHVGLGSGTQLALSIATALARLFSIEAGVRELASVMGRGKRSGIGVAAFDRGGFILDGGQQVATTDHPRNPDSPPPCHHPAPLSEGLDLCRGNPERPPRARRRRRGSRVSSALNPPHRRDRKAQPNHPDADAPGPRGARPLCLRAIPHDHSADRWKVVPTCPGRDLCQSPGGEDCQGDGPRRRVRGGTELLGPNGLRDGHQREGGRHHGARGEKNLIGQG